MSTGSNPVTTIGTANRCADRENIPRIPSPCRRARRQGLPGCCTVRRRKNELEGGGDRDVRTEDREVRQTEPSRLADGHRVGRGGRLEPDGEEDDLLRRVPPGDRHGVERGVDDAHVAALGLDGEEVPRDPGTLSMSPNDVKMTFGPGRDEERLGRSSPPASRTPGTRDRARGVTLSGISGSMPYWTMVVRLAAADLHDDPGAVVCARIWAASPRAASASRNSSRNFTRQVQARPDRAQPQARRPPVSHAASRGLPPRPSC